MMETQYEKMIKLLDTSWCMRDQIVPCLVGPPGIGKTAAVMEHAKTHGCDHVVKIVASRCVPSETVGMTMPNKDNRSMEIYNSMQLSSLKDGDILFLDELLEADQFVLSTLLTVIESREMADGTPLPDIQIIAATNDTIPPEQLKGNIRQRFMFMRFYMDKGQTEQYIKDKTGIAVPGTVLDKLCEKGNDYNFLTPRSLTKLCLWMDAT
jgi:MoxR-like ATPase